MNRAHQERLLKMKQLSGLITEQTYHELIKENKYIDSALDNLSQIGDITKLNELDKLILYSASGDIEACKKLDLVKIYSVNNTFGQRKIKIQIYPANQQPIPHKFSQEQAGNVGYLSPYIHYSEENHQPYNTVTFDELIHVNQHGDTHYKSMPIMLANMFPIGYDDDQIQFVKHQMQRDQQIKDMRNEFGGSAL